MPFDPHERARYLIDESRVAGIPPEETTWLRGHIAECSACAEFEGRTARMLHAMTEFSFVAHASACRVDTRAGVRRRASVWRWPLAAAAAILLAAIPLYQSARNAQRDRADALLLERVEAGVSRSVPEAMQPLINPQLEENQ